MRRKLSILTFVSTLFFIGNCDRHCGYEACPKTDPRMLTVHLVPHTHDDVGWVKTVDEYYYGHASQHGNNGVRTIIEDVVKELMVNETRKFIWVETAYLWKWWTDSRDSSLKEQVKKLVANGQLELTGGAWSMNDEAVNHYQSIIDQFTWGFRRLSDIFGDCGRPHVGWQIDPFGHSRETASLMAQLGFDGLFFARLDEDDRKNRLDTKSMEMIWRGSKNLGEDADLFTGALHAHYSAPKGFCFDIWCTYFISEDPETGNFRQKVSDFIATAKKQSEGYQSNHIMWTMGDDFSYTNATKWFANMDILMSHVNSISEETGIAAVYSTPSCYLQALHASANISWPIKEDDFFPYANEKHTYWTGYFTSRPNLKKLERDGNNLLQVCKQLHVITRSEESDNLIALREAMGVLQHHDAVTGTEKQHVADDYSLILKRSMGRCDDSAAELLNSLAKKSNDTADSLYARCSSNLNLDACYETEESDNFVVTVYNPLARKVSKFVRLPVTTDSGYTVFDYSTSSVLEVQYVPVPQAVLLAPVRYSSATYELVFEAVDLPALGFKSFHVNRQRNNETQKERRKRRVKREVVATEITNDILKVSFDEKTNLIKSVTSNGQEIELTQELMYYESGKGDGKLRSSGAYIFRPDSNTPLKVAKAAAEINIFKGPLVQEVHQMFSNWTSQVVRLYRGSEHVEIEWLVGPIPTEEDKIGKEVISRFTTKIKSNANFTTDSNSREYLTRTRNYRKTWNADIQEPVAGNYYPVTSAISIEDKNMKFAVLTDRPQGGSSVSDGSIELMVHRRLVADDNFGVSEVLNERQHGVGMVARGRHLLLLGPLKSAVTTQERTLVQQEMVLPPTVYISPTKLTVEEWKEKHIFEFSGLKKNLPKNVHLLTLEPWKDGKVLLRLEHIMEKDDDLIASTFVVLTLQDLFEANVKNVMEMTLGANQIWSQNERFKWKEDDGTPSWWKDPTKNETVKNERIGPAKNYVDEANNFTVVLFPMQIRTFIFEFE